jgi:hypothetical protein
MSGFLGSGLAPKEELTPDLHPRVGTFPGMFLKFLPVMTTTPPTEYVRLPAGCFQASDNLPAEAVEGLFCTQWNLAWESGPIREQIYERKIPESLRWIHRYPERNFAFVPGTGSARYAEFSPLYNLLPARILERVGLPAMRCGLWPGLDIQALRYGERLDSLPCDWPQRLGSGLAQLLWPLLYPRPSSPISAFSKNDSLRLLAHNVDFWLPHIDQLLQEMMRDGFRRVTADDDALAQMAELNRQAAANALAGDPEVTFLPGLCGGAIWCGEGEAMEVAVRLVETADRDGRLRAVLDALESNRVEDDFSERWSPAKEDFERKLFSKRSKVRVSFVELDDAPPIHAPEAQVEDNLFWEDFLAVVRPKDRRVLVLLRAGHTQSEIAKHLGYANHSPVSKALRRLAEQAKALLD